MNKFNNAAVISHSVVARRREQFLAIMLCFIFAFLPAVDVMAETVEITGDDQANNVQNVQGRSADKILWDSTGTNVVSGNIKVTYYRGQDRVAEGEAGETNVSLLDPANKYPHTLKTNQELPDHIADFDH